MPTPAIKQATYQDIIDLPENIVGEIINGQLQTLEAYQLHDSHWLLIGAFANDQVVSIAPFAKHAFSLSDLWE
jgi:hypothetical protein